MQIDLSTIAVTIINIVLYLVLLILIFKGIKVIKNFINRNNEMDKKIDSIIKILENKEKNLD
ncbi:hypothetical protein AB2T96_00025 [Clostridium butyricum]|uniref:Uncharacterized protein n=1 Tax=Clostridium butyricum TaxID=1492 RepID=A0A6N3HTY0_CLOBU|nr:MULTISPECIES: hypothetical protein [Clostridium]AXB84993.1 hypothetical protein DRB99_08445 [Clostridium butyricum]MDI9209046.1 hypothetical protein [Clostridium butyricum]MDU1068471.1 hypothetical protein [Clostridium sp.]MDU1338691.1 hypothetical protein [Clostridium butyricum]MDU1603017.1 hypothetical protein [Clostridium sp.]